MVVLVAQQVTLLPVALASYVGANLSPGHVTFSPAPSWCILERGWPQCLDACTHMEIRGFRFQIGTAPAAATIRELSNRHTALSELLSDNWRILFQWQQSYVPR